MQAITILPLTRDNVIASMKSAREQNNYINCRLAVQLTINEPSIEGLQEITFDDLQIGDVIAWSNYRHFALWIGHGQIVQVGGWGEDVTIEDYLRAMECWDQPESFYKHPQR